VPARVVLDHVPQRVAAGLVGEQLRVLAGGAAALVPDHRRRRVDTAPAPQAGAPAEVELLAVETEVFVEPLAGGGDVLEQLAAEEGGGAVRAEGLARLAGGAGGQPGVLELAEAVEGDALAGAVQNLAVEAA